MLINGFLLKNVFCYKKPLTKTIARKSISYSKLESSDWKLKNFTENNQRNFKNSSLLIPKQISISQKTIIVQILPTKLQNECAPCKLLVDNIFLCGRFKQFKKMVENFIFFFLLLKNTSRWFVGNFFRRDRFATTEEPYEISQNVFFAFNC